MKSFRELIVWQKGIQMVIQIYEKTKRFPKEEIFGLKLQIRRCAVSIPSNIAEGYGRYYYQDSIKFYRISRGSLLETLDHLSSALDENYLDETAFNDLKEDQAILLKKLNSYIAYIKRLKET